MISLAPACHPGRPAARPPACKNVIKTTPTQSTLLNMIAGLDTPDMGSLVVGETVDVMYVDQNREGLDNPELSVYDAVTEGAEEINLGPRTINRHVRLSRVLFFTVDVFRRLYVFMQ